MEEILLALAIILLTYGCVWNSPPAYPDFPEPSEKGRAISLIHDGSGCTALGEVRMQGTTGTDKETLEAALREKAAKLGANALILDKVKEGTPMLQKSDAQGRAFKCPDK